MCQLRTAKSRSRQPLRAPPSTTRPDPQYNVELRKLADLKANDKLKATFDVMKSKHVVLDEATLEILARYATPFSLSKLCRTCVFSSFFLSSLYLFLFLQGVRAGQLPSCHPFLRRGHQVRGRPDRRDVQDPRHRVQEREARQGMCQIPHTHPHAASLHHPQVATLLTDMAKKEAKFNSAQTNELVCVL